VAALRPDQDWSLNLAFLDPEGLELQWQTVAKLASIRRMDLIINYPQGGLNRLMKRLFQQESDTVVDRYFGDRNWRTIYADYLMHPGAGLHRHLIDYYKGKLQALGYNEVRSDDEVGDEPLMRNAKRNAPLYRLLFASKHPLGEKFWRAITKRDVHGQMRLFDSD
jgi:three-Cys-motif partner protein